LSLKKKNDSKESTPREHGLYLSPEEGSRNPVLPQRITGAMEWWRECRGKEI